MSTTNAALNPALNWPPVYRQFLAGGTDRLRLTRASLALLLAAAVLLSLAAPLICAGIGWHMRPLWLGLVLVATLQAVLVAALAARWLGNRAGLLAGLLQLTTACLLPSPAALPDALFCLVFSVAMGIVMVAQVSGRAPLVDRPPLGRLFSLVAAIACVLAGPASLILILAVCACQIVASQDRHGLRFFRDPIGLGVFGLVTVAWLVTAWWANRPCTAVVDWGFFSVPAGGTDLGRAASTWGRAALRLALLAPLALPAVCNGLRNGHYATPCWRFLACWCLAPLALLPLGQFHCDLHFGALLPPLAITAAVGLESLLRRARRSLAR
jgi:hypothetical protein